MKLRTRLIVAFLVLSVGPLAAVTYFSYTTQAKALQDLATREADALSSEMTQRMQRVGARRWPRRAGTPAAPERPR